MEAPHQGTADLVIYILYLFCYLFSVGLQNAAEIETEDGVRLTLLVLQNAKYFTDVCTFITYSYIMHEC